MIILKATVLSIYILIQCHQLHTLPFTSYSYSTRITILRVGVGLRAGAARLIQSVAGERVACRRGGRALGHGAGAGARGRQ